MKYRMLDKIIKLSLSAPEISAIGVKNISYEEYDINMDGKKGGGLESRGFPFLLVLESFSQLIQIVINKLTEFKYASILTAIEEAKWEEGVSLLTGDRIEISLEIVEFNLQQKNFKAKGHGVIRRNHSGHGKYSGKELKLFSIQSAEGILSELEYFFDCTDRKLFFDNILSIDGNVAKYF
ncbi:MAG: hypothetical protein HQK49_15795 [Oligoflexia bacterium]|nr:hypothetical protein [Oligoflexia bacterium]